MYISQKNYDMPCEICRQAQERRLVIILPSEPERYLERFEQIIKECANEHWVVTVLNNRESNRTPNYNYISIYYADAIVIECSEKKPNVFYMMGLAHACGRPVCACYREEEGRNAEIPFNVHGRQSMTYSISSTEGQNELKSNFKEWLNEYEHN